MPKYMYVVLAGLIILAIGGVEALDYVAVQGIPEAEAQRFIAQALSIVETIRGAWRETVTYPQLAMSFLLASSPFPNRVAFQRFAAGSKYWDPQKTIYQIQWVPRVINEERDGKPTPPPILHHSQLSSPPAQPFALTPAPHLPAFEALVRSEVALFPAIYAFKGAARVPRPANWSAEYFPIAYISPPDDFIVGLDLNDDVEVPPRSLLGRDVIPLEKLSRPRCTARM
jgi:hypothetical protein